MRIARVGSQGTLRLLKGMGLRDLTGLQAAMEVDDQFSRRLIVYVP
jgi:hypothetical protein